MLHLETSYEDTLKSAKTTRIGSKTHNALSNIGGVIIKPMTIAPLNTNVDFSNVQVFESQYHPGLSAIQNQNIPENFNWRTDKNKGHLISKPGNQMLCGSCWAISAAGIISDNFVVSNLVQWNPQISVTWILNNYPQLQCGGGNPAKVFNDIRTASSKNMGLTSDCCIDYSWCATNEHCNGNAQSHLDNTKFTSKQLSALIPKKKGCYCVAKEHYLYKITEPVYTIAIGAKTKDSNIITEKDWPAQLINIKKHIMLQGPVLGGFLVFENFMNGIWTSPNKSNKGIYLENGIYDTGGNVVFDDNQVDSKHYKGSHAVAIIGWGVEKNVVVDNNGTQKDVPYWYCRNSWTEKWGKDGGYFKMAMYPHNKMAQFDKIVILSTKTGRRQAGGIVLIKTTEKPVKSNFDKIDNDNTIFKGTDFDKEYCTDCSQNTKSLSSYQNGNGNENGNGNGNGNENPWGIKKIIGGIIILLLISLVIFLLIRFFQKKPSRNKPSRNKPSRNKPNLDIYDDMPLQNLKDYF